MPAGPTTDSTLPRPRWVLSKASRRKASARCRPTKAVSPRSSARSKRARPLSRRVAVKVRHRRRQPLQRHLAGGLDDEVAAHQAHRGFADPRAARRRHLLQARREVHRLALGRVVHAQVVADLADDDRPGVDPDAHGEVEAALCAQRGRVLPHRLLDGQGRRHRPHRVVLVGDGRSEERHDAVAGELVDGPLEAVDRLQQVLEAAVHHPVQILGIETRGELGEAGAIDEDDRDLLALALDGAPRGEDPVGQVLGGVAPRGRGRRRRRGGRGGRRRADRDRPATLVAELRRRTQRGGARRARAGQRGAAAVTEPGRGPVVGSARRARHSDILRRSSGNTAAREALFSAP